MCERRMWFVKFNRFFDIVERTNRANELELRDWMSRGGGLVERCALSRERCREQRVRRPVQDLASGIQI